jgi:CheY-like chemotaxis protein
METNYRVVGERMLKPLFVLALDDELDQLELTKFFLEENDPDLVVDTLSNPEEILEKIQNKPYDCILADYAMPRINGVELATTIKEIKDIPFVLYTGRGSEQTVLDAISAGVDAYVRKDHNPEHFTKLAKEIRRAVSEHNRARNDSSAEPVKLPKYPKAEVRERSVIIIYEGGEEQLWSEEPDEVKAYQVAEEIQSGLRMRHYVKDKLRHHMDSISDSLLDMNVPVEEIEDIVFEGYRSLNKYFKMLWQSSS